MNEFLKYMDKYKTMKNIEFNMELEIYESNLQVKLRKITISCRYGKFQQSYSKPSNSHL